MAASAGWHVAGVLTDPEALVAVAILRPSPNSGS